MVDEAMAATARLVLERHEALVRAAEDLPPSAP
jgi:citrate lyase subunit beta / citryl-CoA lyase